MQKIRFGKDNEYYAVIYNKEEVDGKVTNKLVAAGYNAREGVEEQKYLILIGEQNDLNPRKNPYFNTKTKDKNTDAKFIVVYKENKPVGRSIILYDPLYNEYHSIYNREAVVWLGWPEFENIEVGKKILEISIKQAKEFKKKDPSLKYLIGPGRPNEQGIVGLRIAGSFIYFMEPDNPLWYEEVFNQSGVLTDNYWTSIRYRKQDIENWKRLLNTANQFLSEKNKAKIKMIKINKFTLSKHLNGIYKVYRDAWLSEEHIHGRTLTAKEFNYMVSGIKILIPLFWDNVYVVKDTMKNETVGISISVPNFNEVLEKIKSNSIGERIRKEIAVTAANFFGLKHYKSGRIFIAGVVPEKSGIEKSIISAGMISNAIKNFSNNGINDISMSQLAIPNKDVVIPLLVAHKVDKGLLRKNYKENIIPILKSLSKEGKASLAAVYKIPI